MLEAENRSLTEQLSRSASQQKDMVLSLVLLMRSIVVCNLSCTDLEVELNLSLEAVAQLQKEKEEAEEKTERVTMDLEREYMLC